ncbi:MAG: polymer-forming cytoskeletal protein [Mangrovibacterium sp.]
MAKANQETQQVFTIIGKGTIVRGNMNVEGDTRIDGTLDGTISCSGKLIVGISGKILGDVDCANFEVLGEVEGNILVKEKTLLREKSKLIGDLITSVLNIEPTATFTGTCDMGGETRKAKSEMPKKFEKLDMEEN